MCGMYYHRPASELVFLSGTEHRRLHRLGNLATDESRARMSAAHVGLRHSELTKTKISMSMVGIVRSEETRQRMSSAKCGMRFWNDGRQNVRARECPPGFRPGRIRKLT